VTPSGRMECGVSPSGRRISLKGAVAHFFLSFLPHATTCFLCFLIEEPDFLSCTPLSPRTVCSLCAALVLFPLRSPRAVRSLHTTLVLSSLRTICLPPPLSCPRGAPSARLPSPVLATRRPLAAAPPLSSLRAICSSPPLSCPRCAPPARRRRPCPVLAARCLLAAALVLPAPGSPPDPAPLYFVASPPALPVAEPPNRPQNPSSWRKKCPKRHHSRHR